MLSVPITRFNEHGILCRTHSVSSKLRSKYPQTGKRESDTVRTHNDGQMQLSCVYPLSYLLQKKYDHLVVVARHHCIEFVGTFQEGTILIHIV